MSIVITAQPPATPHMLVHPDAPVGYSFAPTGTSVTVTHTIKRSARGASIRDVYILAVEDARRLWRFLRAKGFEQF